MLILGQSASGSASEKSVSNSSEIASGDFFELDLDRLEKKPAALELQQVIILFEFRTASGVIYYAYCHNDPINYVDILGLMAWKTVVNGLKKTAITTGRLNGRAIRNFHWRGKVRPFNDLSDVTRAGNLEKIYGKIAKGVKYTDEGLGDFSAFAKKLPDGSRKIIFDDGVLKATGHRKQVVEKFKEMGLNEGEIAELFKGNRLHHAPDGKSIELIPEAIHTAFGHTGGASLIQHANRTMAQKGLYFGFALIAPNVMERGVKEGLLIDMMEGFFPLAQEED